AWEASGLWEAVQRAACLTNVLFAVVTALSQQEHKGFRHDVMGVRNNETEPLLEAAWSITVRWQPPQAREVKCNVDTATTVQWLLFSTTYNDLELEVHGRSPRSVFKRQDIMV
ncbi:hypothetical protein A2U01_0009666, partial [Trifolium medium]|nr:hypothetical protein [Trifolium medium]